MSQPGRVHPGLWCLYTSWACMWSSPACKPPHQAVSPAPSPGSQTRQTQRGATAQQPALPAPCEAGGPHFAASVKWGQCPWGPRAGMTQPLPGVGCSWGPSRWKGPGKPGGNDWLFRAGRVSPVPMSKPCYLSSPPLLGPGNLKQMLRAHASVSHGF